MSLAGFLDRFDWKEIPEKLKKTIIRQILIGFDFLHNTCGIMHNNIKPENILFKIEGYENVLLDDCEEELRRYHEKLEVLRRRIDEEIEREKEKERAVDDEKIKKLTKKQLKKYKKKLKKKKKKLKQKNHEMEKQIEKCELQLKYMEESRQMEEHNRISLELSKTIKENKRKENLLREAKSPESRITKTSKSINLKQSLMLRKAKSYPQSRNNKTKQQRKLRNNLIEAKKNEDQKKKESNSKILQRIQRFNKKTF